MNNSSLDLSKLPDYANPERAQEKMQYAEKFNNGFNQGLERFQTTIFFMFFFMLLTEVCRICLAREWFESHEGKFEFLKGVAFKAAFTISLYLVSISTIYGKVLATTTRGAN